MLHWTRRWVVWPLIILPATWVLGAETERQYLSGHGKDDPVTWNFFCTTGKQSGYWTNLPVPSNWEFHGFGTMSYHRDGTNPPPEQGLYRYEFKAPAKWAKRRVFLVFEGVMTDATASLNGRAVGAKHQGAFYRFKYDVSELLNFGGKNLLEVTVDKRSANASVNDAERKGDYWMFGGIYRPVYLEGVPPEFIERLAIDAQANGNLAADVYVNGVADNAEGVTVEGQVLTVTEKVASQPFSSRLDSGKTRLIARLDSPRQWSAETPNLYELDVRLKRGAQVLHRVRQRFGFRTMEVREGDGLYVNGQRVILKGCDRHSFWPDSGRCLSEAVHRMDIAVMQEMNMNAVRMSHYPPDAEFLDLCDELGLYVLDELAGWHWAYDTETGRKLVQEMVVRDVNHPSILFWNNGNEGGFNTNLDNVFGELDPQQRRVLHPWARFSGVNTAHYLAYDKAQAACEGLAAIYRSGTELVDTNDTAHYIYMPTEFLHGLYDGGAGAGMEDYWELMRKSKFIGGGFVWALLDEGVIKSSKRQNPTSREAPNSRHQAPLQFDVAGNQAPDGIVGPYREKEGSFYAIKEIWSPILATRAADGAITIENRYSFINANECRFRWQLRRFREPADKKTGFSVVKAGDAKAPSIPPGGTGTLTLELPSTAVGDALALSVDDPRGRELWTWVWPLSDAPVRPAISSGERRKFNQVHVRETEAEVVAEAGSLLVSFDKTSGMLKQVRQAQQSFSLMNGPRPVPGEAQLVSIASKMEKDEAVVTANYTGALKQVVWHVLPSGWLECDYVLHEEGPRGFFGVAFDYPEEKVKGKKWLGQGPYRVWQNRMRGEMLNVWQNDYNNTITGWKDWVYPEFKGCFAGVRWMQLQTSEGLITADLKQRNIFVQVLQPEQAPPELRGKTDVALPKLGLGFLHAIPAIGSKFKPADQGGPQGAPTIAKGDYTGSISFFFGELR